MKTIEIGDLAKDAAPYAGHAALGMLAFVAGLFLAWLAKRMILRAMRKCRTESTVARFVSQLTYAILLAVTVAVALGAIGVQTASIAAIIGAAGIAIGLSLQSSLSNLASGLLLVTLKPFRAGDYIEGADQAGTVVEVGLFATTLRTIDGKTAVIPNSLLTNGCIVNYSAHPMRRMDLSVSVAYATDLEAAKKVLLDTVSADSRVIAESGPIVSVNELGDSGIEMGVRFWVNNEDYWPMRFEILGKIKAALDAAGIEIPFPQRVVSIKK